MSEAEMTTAADLLNLYLPDADPIESRDQLINLLIPAIARARLEAVKEERQAILGMAMEHAGWCRRGGACSVEPSLTCGQNIANWILKRGDPNAAD